ncbi:MAG: DsbC family protein [Duodenibacillus sp.]|nr:DsbC family protein [Duodenibacillus sp.]
MRAALFGAAATITAALAAATSAFAADTASAAGKLEDQIAARVLAVTTMKPDSVRSTPVKGLYEVVVKRRVFYVDENVTHLIVGRIFEAATETDITARRIEELSRIDWKELPLQDAIKVVYGKGERKVAVFTDARCTYCQMLEKTLRETGNVTVYNFLYPILNSREVARNIVCSKDPAKALQEHMLNGTEPPAAKCDDSMLDRNLALGAKFEISGTPFIIFENGSRVTGALPSDQLNRGLNLK